MGSPGGHGVAAARMVADLARGRAQLEPGRHRSRRSGVRVGQGFVRVDPGSLRGRFGVDPGSVMCRFEADPRRSAADSSIRGGDPGSICGKKTRIRKDRGLYQGVTGSPNLLTFTMEHGVWRGWLDIAEDRASSSTAGADHDPNRPTITSSEMREMWEEAQRPAQESGHTIDESDDGNCMIYHVAGTKWDSTTPKRANARKILGHDGAEHTSRT